MNRGGFKTALYLPNEIITRLDEFKQNIIKGLIDYRKQHELTVAEIANIIGYKDNTISFYVNNPENVPTSFLFTVIRFIEYPFPIDPLLVDEIKNWDPLIKHTEIENLQKGLKEYILLKGLNQARVSELIGISRSEISLFFNGKGGFSEKLLCGLLELDKEYFSQFIKGNEMLENNTNNCAPINKPNYENSPFRKRVAGYMATHQLKSDELGELVDIRPEKLDRVMNFQEPLSPEIINHFSKFDSKSFPPDQILTEYFIETAGSEKETIVFKSTPIRNRLKDYMEKNQLTYKSLAKRLKYSNGYVKHILTGNTAFTEPFLLSIVSLDRKVFPEQELRMLWEEEKKKAAEEFRNQVENKPAETLPQFISAQNIHNKGRHVQTQEPFPCFKRLYDNRVKILKELKSYIGDSKRVLSDVSFMTDRTAEDVLRFIQKPDEVSDSFLFKLVNSVPYAFDLDLDLYRNVVFNTFGFKEQWPEENKIIYDRIVEYLVLYSKTYKEFCQHIGMIPENFLGNLFTINHPTDAFYEKITAKEGGFFRIAIPKRIKEKFMLQAPTSKVYNDSFIENFARYRETRQQESLQHPANTDPMYHAAIGVIIAALDKAQQLNPTSTNIGQIEKIVQHPLVQRWMNDRLFKS